MVRIQEERDLETLRQIGILLDNENKRLIDKTRRLTLELARRMGLDEKQCEQMELSVLEELQKKREHVFRLDERKKAEQEAKESKEKKPVPPRLRDLRENASEKLEDVEGLPPRIGGKGVVMRRLSLIEESASTFRPMDP